MATRKAIVIKGAKDAVVEDITMPELAPRDILVKTTAVALNPVDHAFIDYMPAAGVVVGCDYAGIVEEVGSDVTNGLKVGDRVAGFVPGGNGLDPAGGAFATKVKAPGDIQMKVPDNFSDEEAATMGVGIITAGIALFDTVALGLPSPTSPAKEPIPVLIYGGSTATGAIAIQLAKLANLLVLTTCSPSNADYCRSLGATHVVDYNSPTCVADLGSASPKPLQHAFDCVSTPSSTAICAAALSSGAGSKYAHLQPVPDFPRGDVATRMINAFDVFGRPFRFGPQENAVREGAWEFARGLMQDATALVAEGKLKAHRPSVRDGGLEAVLQGLQELREGKVSGKKIVVKM